MTFLFVSVAALQSSFAASFNYFSATSEKPFHAVSEENMKTAHCLQTTLLTEQEMLSWLDWQARVNDGQTVAQPLVHILGLDIVNESPYRIQLLEKLLTVDSWSNFPQATFSSHCHDVVCAVKDLFGDQTGVPLLYMLARHGFNGSHLRIKDADAWTREELDVVLLALSDLPKHLRLRKPDKLNHTLVHFKRSYESPNQPIANAVIYVYNEWNRLTPELQRYAIFHEAGHNMGLDFGYDSLKDWYKVADWSEKLFEWSTTTPEKKISLYAESNPSEDFAESFAAYRYNPIALRNINPAVYHFFKVRVFKKIEYTTRAACLQN